jgi:hypothetical protein
VPPPKELPPQERDYRRWVLGILAVVMGAAAIWLNLIDPELGSRNPQFAGGTMRMAFVLAILWLALPDVLRGPALFFYLLVAVVAVVAMIKGGKNSLKLIVPAMMLLGVLSFLRRFTGGPHRR